ncbi:MAG: DNA polymerase IV [Promethearchaeota archaeon]
MTRLIIHCDLDCFFAAVEVRDNPKYRGKPVIIGADPKEGNGRGVVSTCSYEARVFGIHSGMPISHAYQRCSQGIYLRPNGEKYRKVSKQVMQILNKYSDTFQQAGIDEAYLEFTEICSNFKEVKNIAENIQNNIHKNLGITISIGCAPTKSLAKIASDCNKPKGITIFTPNNFKDKLKDLEITKIPGIGKKSKKYLYKKNIRKIGDILKFSLQKFRDLFGKNGEWIWKVVNGFDNRKVREFDDGRKSISAERTFFADTDDFQEVLSKLEDINNKIHKSVVKNNITYKTITLKIRFKGYLTYTRSKTLSYHTQDKNIVMDEILKLYKEFSNNKKKIRLVGIKLSNLELNIKSRQTNLLSFASVSIA